MQRSIHSIQTECPYDSCNSMVKLSLLSDHTTCSKCTETFYYIQCYYCAQLIFFKQATNTNGFNIRCPYKQCGMIICREQCSHCNKFIMHRNTYYQGETSTCIDCERKFTILTCPFSSCGKALCLEPSYVAGNPLRCVNHSPPKCFQKLPCMSCYRLLYFDNNIQVNGVHNLYIPTQLVECPYEKCGAKTQQVECENCSWRWFVMGHKWSFGKTIACINDNCNKEFAYTMCPECLKVQRGERCMECENVKCMHCQNEYQFTNCRKCHEVIFWSKQKGKQYQYLQLIKCPTCGNLFQTIKCNECKHLSTFFANSMKLSVPHCCKSCLKKKTTTYWSMYFCAKCGVFNMKKVKEASSNKHANRLIVKIDGDSACTKCRDKNTFVNTQCPHCFYVHTVVSNKKAKSASYISKVKCQNKMCLKYFYYYKCSCGLDYTREDINNAFKCVVCSESITEYYCPICHRKSVNIQSKCDRCHNPNTIVSPEPNEDIVLKFVDFQQGDIHTFGKPEKDYGEVQISENMIQTKRYFEMNNKLIYENENAFSQFGISFETSSDDTKWSSKNTGSVEEVKENCIICCQKSKESVFVPCGHRCVCFDCGKEYIENKNKTDVPKCPICKEIILDFLEKVDDSDIVL